MTVIRIVKKVGEIVSNTTKEVEQLLNQINDLCVTSITDFTKVVMKVNRCDFNFTNQINDLTDFDLIQIEFDNNTLNVIVTNYTKVPTILWTSRSCDDDFDLLSNLSIIRRVLFDTIENYNEKSIIVSNIISKMFAIQK